MVPSRADRTSLSDGLPIQIFGRKDSRDTQKARRFFQERRAFAAYVDLTARPIAPTELRRFAERVGVQALLDVEGKWAQEVGLRYLRMDDRETFDRLLSDHRLLRLPLVRRGPDVTVGLDESAWKTWLAGQPQG